ncbi:MAG: DUF4040 domain-containing protein [Bdellovibrionaceae bacterium]|nr:DUF4040 domain-containing protein [Pseudobdellovibrionaceae bacterium]
MVAPLLAAVPLALAAFFAWLVQGAPDGLFYSSLPWAPSIGLNLSFRIDGLSQLFLLLILGVGFVIQSFAAVYFQGKFEMWRRYRGPMLLFTLAMVGAVTSDNLLLLFMFWEMTSLASFFLIGLERERVTARHAAQMALIVTGAGGLCLLAGALMLGQMAGHFEISRLLGEAASLRDHPWLPAVFALFALGALTKSAQFPFHFWLPNAMAAPAPVSAYLHSATMVKLGIYLLYRFYPLFGSLEWWPWVLIGSGGITFVWGAWVALHKTDLKSLLANTTISGLGLLVLCLGVGTPGALTAGLVFLLAHALYKAPMFLLTGVIEKKVGTRDLRELTGLGWKIPGLTLAMALAAGSMAGLPPGIGFVAKELAIEFALTGDYLIMVFVFWGSVFTIATALRLAHAPFWGRPAANIEPREIVAGSAWGITAAPLVLTIVGLAAGIFVAAAGAALIDPTLSAIGSPTTESALSLWHGLNWALGLGIFTWIAGALVYRFHPIIETFGSRAYFDGDYAYEVVLRGTLRAGATLTRLLQNGSLQFYLIVNVFAIIGAGYLAYWTAPALSLELLTTEATHPPIYDIQQIWGILLCFLMMGMAGLSLTTRYALTSVLGMSGVGFAVVVFFVFFGAPDLALTQFAVECIGLLILVLILPSMPPFRRMTTSGFRRFQTMLSVGAGFMVFLGVWIGQIKGNASGLSEYFGAQSWLEANGRNVVNVILVDFRGLDTMGEITVLVIAALGVGVLLRRPTQPDGEKGSE